MRCNTDGKNTLYDKNNRPTEECVGPAPKTDDHGPSLVEEEIMTMLKELKNGKAEWVDVM